MVHFVEFAIGLLSLPVGIGAGIIAGRAVYYDLVPRSLVSVIIGFSIAFNVFNSLMSLSLWLAR